MDQGIIQTLKLKYRRRQLQQLLSATDNTQDCSQLLKGITILDAIYWIAKSWDEVEPSTIQKCFLRCGFQLCNVDSIVDDSCDDYDDNVPLSMIRLAWDLFDCEFKELAIDIDVLTCDTNEVDWKKTASELIKDNDCNDESDDNDETVLDEKIIVTADQAKVHLDQLKLYILSAGDSAMLNGVMDLEDMFVQQRMDATSKQTTMKDFFK